MSVQPANAREPDGVHTWTAVLVLSALAVAAYANSFAVPLLFDDWVTILHNPKLRQVWPIWEAFSPPEYSGVGGRPVANLSFVLNYAVSGESVRGFHAGNLLIHVLAALALFGLVRRTLWRARWQSGAGFVALAVAALWMLQPVQTQSVTYVSQRTESLMGLFYFLTLYCFARAADAARPLGWNILTVVSCLAGMATKEGMVTAPVMVLVYDCAFVTRSVSGSLRRRWPLLLALASSWLLLAWLMRGLPGRGVGFGHGMSPWSYLLIECRAVMIYLRLAVWPWPLVFDYGTDLGAPGAVEFACAAGLSALAGATVYALWRFPAAGFLGAWFFITLSPTSSIVPIPLQPISENRVYVPTAAVVAALVLAFWRVAGRRSMGPLALVAGAFTLLTLARNADYRSEIAIWADTVAKRPGSARAHSNLGHALQSAGRLHEARAAHEKALAIRPNYAEAHTNLAAVLGQLGDAEGAVRHSRRAAEIDPLYAAAFHNLGVALTQRGDIAGAIAAYEQALRVRPDAPDTRNNLALLLLQAGRVHDALAHAQAALQLQPNHVLARFTAGCALVLSGRPAEAVPLFQQVLQAQPRHVEAQHNLGVALLQLGRANEAFACFQAALQLDPTHANARLQVANLLLNSGRAADAVPHFETVLHANPALIEPRVNLAVALAATGRVAEAIAHLEAALQLDPNSAVARQHLERLRADAR